MTPCVVGADAEPSVAVIGDSHALVLSPIAQDTAKALGKAAVVVATSTCPPLPGRRCLLLRAAAPAPGPTTKSWLGSNGGRSTVGGAVLAARWSFYNEQDAPARDAILPQLVWTDAQGTQPRLSRRSLGDRACRFHRGAGTGPPRADRRPGAGAQASDREIACERAQLTGSRTESCAVRRSDVEQRHREAWQVLRGVAAKFPNVAADRSGRGAVRPRHLPAVRRQGPATMSTRIISACSAPSCCTGDSSANSAGCTATGPAQYVLTPLTCP